MHMIAYVNLLVHLYIYIYTDPYTYQGCACLSVRQDMWKLYMLSRRLIRSTAGGCLPCTFHLEHLGLRVLGGVLGVWV